MKITEAPAQAFLQSLLELFPRGGVSATDMTWIPGNEVPEPYRRLLVHTHHMTVTLEAFHRSPVVLQVLDRSRAGDDYARQLKLTAGPAGRVVLLGIMRLRLAVCSERVRQRVTDEGTPLGRILIEEDVLRRIEPWGFFRVHLNDPTRAQFGVRGEAASTYGRVAVIICDGEPAVELLEIVSPEEP